MSHSRLQSAFMEVLETLDLPASIEADQLYGTIEPYFADMPEDANTLEVLKIKMGKNLPVTVASKKISNLKFRLKDLLMETWKTAVKVQGARQNGLALALVILEFLQKVSGFMEYQLTEREAKILLEMCTLENEKEKMTVDVLFGRLKPHTEEEILHSLDLLEKLACIQYGMDELMLVESIVFTQE